MTTTHTNLALVEGEVYIYKPKAGHLRTLIATTNKRYQEAAQLDRKHFVKPKVDVDELASNYAEREQRVLWENEHIVSEAFKAGYNAKEGEFTQGDIAILWAAMILDNTLSLEYILFKLRSLSLPKSVTLNENNEVIEVTW